MTDHCDWLARAVEALHKIARLFIHSQLIGVQRAARQHECVVILWVCFIERQVSINFLAFSASSSLALFRPSER